MYGINVRYLRKNSKLQNYPLMGLRKSTIATYVIKKEGHKSSDVSLYPIQARLLEGEWSIISWLQQDFHFIRWKEYDDSRYSSFCRAICLRRGIRTYGIVKRAGEQPRVIEQRSQRLSGDAHTLTGPRVNYPLYTTPLEHHGNVSSPRTETEFLSLRLHIYLYVLLSLSLSLSIYIYIYKYIYKDIYKERNREI